MYFPAGTNACSCFHTCHFLHCSCFELCLVLSLGIITFWCYFLSWEPFNYFRLLSECSWYYSQGSLTKITLQHLSFCWERGSAKFSINYSKYKVIAVVANEVEHPVMRNLEYLYAYLYLKWFLFILKVFILSSKVCY